MASSTHETALRRRTRLAVRKMRARRAPQIAITSLGTARRRLVNNYAILLQRYHRARQRAAESRDVSRHRGIQCFTQGLELAELDGSFGPDRADRPAEQPKRNFGGKFAPISAAQRQPPGIRRQTKAPRGPIHNGLVRGFAAPDAARQTSKASGGQPFVGQGRHKLA